jgi:hypothetical protein
LIDIDAVNFLKRAGMKATNKRIKLNWEKLLGFSQVKVAQGERKSKAAKAKSEP